MDRDFEIGHVQTAKTNDPRGPTYEWKLSDGKSITVYMRKKGCTFGGHFHRGTDPSKNPERFFVIKGQMIMRFIKQNCTDQTVMLGQGDVITIYPGVRHCAEAIEDVIYVEDRLTHFDPINPDTYSC